MAAKLGLKPQQIQRYEATEYESASLRECTRNVGRARRAFLWWHVERFAYPAEMPVFVIAPPGRSHWRAGDLAATGRGLGRRVIAVTHKDDTEVTRHAFAVFPVQGEVREEFSPVLYHLFASYVASYVTARLGRSLFQSDRPELLQSVEEYYASLQQEKGFTTTTKEATMKKR